MKKIILIMFIIAALLALFLVEYTGQVMQYTHAPPNTMYCCYGRTAIPYSIPDNVYQRDMAMICQQYGGTVLRC